MTVPKQYTLIANGRYGQIYLDELRSPMVVMKTVDLISIPKADKLLLEKEFTPRQVEIHRLFHSPYIVGYIENYVKNAVQHIVLEYCNQGDLRQQILSCKEKNERFDSEQILEWTFEILQALVQIHSERIIHRDIKPENILLHRNESGCVVCKVADFGLSYQLSDTEASCTTFTGTPLYMAPELVNGSEYGYSVDIWSLGCIVYELCTLHPPFDAEELSDVLQTILHTNYKPLPANRFPQSLIDLIAIMLNKQSRPSALELLRMPVFYRFHYMSPLSHIDAHKPAIASKKASSFGAPSSLPTGTQAVSSNPYASNTKREIFSSSKPNAVAAVSTPVVVKAAIPSRDYASENIAVPLINQKPVVESNPHDRIPVSAFLANSKERNALGTSVVPNAVEKRRERAITTSSSSSSALVPAKHNSSTLRKQNLITRYTLNRAQGLHPKAIEKPSTTRSSLNAKKRKVSAATNPSSIATAPAATRAAPVVGRKIQTPAHVIHDVPDLLPTSSLVPYQASESCKVVNDSTASSFPDVPSSSQDARSDAMSQEAGNQLIAESDSTESAAYDPSAHPFGVQVSVPLRSQESQPVDLQPRKLSGDFDFCSHDIDVDDLLLPDTFATSLKVSRTLISNSRILDKPKGGYRFNAQLLPSTGSNSSSVPASVFSGAVNGVNLLSKTMEASMPSCPRPMKLASVFQTTASNRIALPRERDKNALDLRPTGGFSDPVVTNHDDFMEYSFISKSVQEHDPVPVATGVTTTLVVGGGMTTEFVSHPITSRTSNSTPLASEKKVKSLSKSMNVQVSGENVSNNVVPMMQEFDGTEASARPVVVTGLHSTKVLRSIPRLLKTSDTRRTLTGISGTSAGPIKSHPLFSNSMNYRSRKSSVQGGSSQSQTKSSSRTQVARTNHASQNPVSLSHKSELDRIRVVKSNVVKRTSDFSGSTKRLATQTSIRTHPTVRRKTVVRDRPLATSVSIASAPRIADRSQTKAESTSRNGRSIPLSSGSRVAVTASRGSGGVPISNGLRSGLRIGTEASQRYPKTMPTEKSRRFRSDS